MGFYLFANHDRIHAGTASAEFDGHVGVRRREGEEADAERRRDPEISGTYRMEVNEEILVKQMFEMRERYRVP
jgi:hypothetical protein